MAHNSWWQFQICKSRKWGVTPLLFWEEEKLREQISRRLCPWLQSLQWDHRLSQSSLTLLGNGKAYSSYGPVKEPPTAQVPCGHVGPQVFLIPSKYGHFWQQYWIPRTSTQRWWIYWTIMFYLENRSVHSLSCAASESQCCYFSLGVWVCVCGHSRVKL